MQRTVAAIKALIEETIADERAEFLEFVLRDVRRLPIDRQDLAAILDMHQQELDERRALLLLDAPAMLATIRRRES